jgi:hypothetical protein
MILKDALMLVIDDRVFTWTKSDGDSGLLTSLSGDGAVMLAELRKLMPPLDGTNETAEHVISAAIVLGKARSEAVSVVVNVGSKQAF